MAKIDLGEVKYKLMSEYDIFINLDRLTRFKNPAAKYPRVFGDILTKFLISPKLSKKQISLMPAKDINVYVEFIWNESVKTLYSQSDYDKNFYKIIRYLDEKIFSDTSIDIKKFMSAKLNICPCIKAFSKFDDLPQNLELLTRAINDDFLSIEELYKEMVLIREKFKLKFPIKKLVLVEGITEEILLPVFAKKFGYDFDKNGIYVLGAGGKSKILRLYNEYKNIVKIPVSILLDNDAQSVYNQLEKDLRVKDKAMLINQGEFEDILPLTLIKKTINSEYYDIEKVKISELREDKPMCETLHDIYKLKGIGEFQKAHFAQSVSKYISSCNEISVEINGIINFIQNS